MFWTYMKKNSWLFAILFKEKFDTYILVWLKDCLIFIDSYNPFSICKPYVYDNLHNNQGPLFTNMDNFNPSMDK